MLRRTLIALLLMAALLIVLRLGALRLRPAPAPVPEGNASQKTVGASSAESDSIAAPGRIQPTDAPEVSPEKTYHIAGRVVRFDGAPAAGCWVSLFNVGSYADLGFGFPNDSMAADTEGRFRFDGLSGRDTDRWRVVVSSVPSDEEICKEVDVRDASQCESVVLALSELRDIRALVVDERGVGVPGIRVMFESKRMARGLRRADLPFEKVTDSSGLVAATVCPGRASVRVWLEIDEYSDDDSQPQLFPQPVELPRDHNSVRFVLKDAELATGSLTSLDDEPLPRQTVYVVRGEQVIALARTDSEGRFSAPVPPGEAVSLRIGAGCACHRRDDESVQGRLDGVRAGDHDLHLKLHLLPEDRHLRIRVQNPEGGPVEDSDVEIRYDDDYRCSEARTDSAGVAEFPRLPAMNLMVQVHPPGHADLASTPGWLPADEVRVLPDGQEIVIRFRSSVRLDGIVLGPDGEPRPGACIVACRSGAKLVRAGADGHFSISVDPDDSAERDLEAWASDGEGRLSAKLTGVDPRGGEVVIRLQREK